MLLLWAEPEAPPLAEGQDCREEQYTAWVTASMVHPLLTGQHTVEVVMVAQLEPWRVVGSRHMMAPLQSLPEHVG